MFRDDLLLMIQQEFDSLAVSVFHQKGESKLYPHGCLDRFRRRLVCMVAQLQTFP